MSARVGLRVTFLGHVAQISGAEMEMLRLIEAADTIESTVILAEDGPLVGALRDAGARVEIMPLTDGARLIRRDQVRLGRAQAAAAVDVARYIRKLRGRLRELAPDVVSVVSLKAGVYGSLAARAGMLPCVWHLHDQIDPSYLAREAVLPMRAIIGTVPNAVVSPSQTTLDTVGRFRPGIRTAVIPHPVPIPDEPVPLRDRVTRIGIVGRLAPWKGQDVFLEAFAQAVPDTDVQAVVVGAAMFGEEEYAAGLQAQATRLGVADRVEFRGFRLDVLEEFRNLDLLVHASVLTEPFGTVVFEAMAAGLPVIAARSGGLAEYIGHERHGLLHSPGDARELGTMMRRAMDDRELRHGLASSGRELTRAFAAEPIARRWIELYEAVLGRPPMPAADVRPTPSTEQPVR